MFAVKGLNLKCTQIREPMGASISGLIVVRVVLVGGGLN